MLNSTDIRTFKTVGNFNLPSVPADESVRKIRDRAWSLLRKQEDDPFITDESLRWAPRGKLDELASPPACGPVMRELAETFKEWTKNPAPNHWLQLVVLPPCEKNDIVHSWATMEGHTIVPPPLRGDINDAQFDASVLDADGDGLIVVPRLEQWFIRHRRGLALVRSLVDRLAMLQRHCVVGCNSWAWEFLSKAVEVDLAFPTGLTFQAFDAVRLHGWFEELAENGDERFFRSALDGNDVFALKDSGELASDYFPVLAARSLGIPWVAWHLWRRSLRVGPVNDDRQAQKFPDEETVWVAPLANLKFPDGRTDVSLLTLHAILMHGRLTPDELKMVMPSIDTSNVLVALLASGFIERDGKHYYCTAAAYPTLRARLASAGFPTDKL